MLRVTEAHTRGAQGPNCRIHAGSTMRSIIHNAGIVRKGCDPRLADKDAVCPARHEFRQPPHEKLTASLRDRFDPLLTRTTLMSGLIAVSPTDSKMRMATLIKAYGPGLILKLRHYATSHTAHAISSEMGLTPWTGDCAGRPLVIDHVRRVCCAACLRLAPRPQQRCSREPSAPPAVMETARRLQSSRR